MRTVPVVFFDAHIHERANILAPAVVEPALPAKKFKHTDLRLSRMPPRDSTLGTSAIVLKEQIRRPVPYDGCAIG